MTQRTAEDGRQARPPLRLRASIAVLAALAVSALVSSVALAHGGGTAVFVDRDTVQPGGTVVVRGEDLGGGATVALVLTGSDGAAIELARVPADADGHVEVAVVLPLDLTPAAWTLTATGDGGDEASLLFHVEGPPIVPEPEFAGGQGGRDEDDPLLVALPEGWQQSLSSPAAAASAPPIRAQGGENGSPPVAATEGTSVPPPLIGLVAFVGGAVALAMGRLLTGRRAGS